MQKIDPSRGVKYPAAGSRLDAPLPAEIKRRRLYTPAYSCLPFPAIFSAFASPSFPGKFSTVIPVFCPVSERHLHSADMLHLNTGCGSACFPDPDNDSGSVHRHHPPDNRADPAVRQTESLPYPSPVPVLLQCSIPYMAEVPQ